MCIPSSLDPTISPPSSHVVTLFVQYTPYTLAKGSWENPSLKNEVADRGSISLFLFYFIFKIIFKKKKKKKKKKNIK